MSENEHVKIQKILLNQLAKDTPLNKVFKLVFRFQKRSRTYLKGNSKLREFKYR